MTDDRRAMMGDRRPTTDDRRAMPSPFRRVAASPRPAYGRIAASLLLLVLLVLVVRLLPSGRDATWARIQQTGVWRVGMDPSFPPFQDLDKATGKPIGFDVDMAEAIAAHWGVRVEIAGVGFDQLVDAVAAHRVDSAVSAMPILEHRAKEVSFSTPYIEAGTMLVAPVGSSIGSPDDLGGRRVAVEWGSDGDAQARAIQRRSGKELTLVLRDSADAALAALLAGEADAAVVDAISLALFPRGEGRLRSVGKPLRADPYVVVMPVDAPQLRTRVNEALAALAADGTLAGLKARWMGQGE